MRIRLSLTLLVTGAFLLVLGAAQFAVSTGASAQPFGYNKLTPNQQRHVSGLLSLELGGAGLKAAAPVKTSPSPVAQPGCDMNLGSNIKVNQNCLNLTDPALNGRGQAQNETWVAADPLNSRNIVAGYNDYRRGDSTCGISYTTTGGRTWADAMMPNGFVKAASSTSHTFRFILSHSIASSLTSAMLTARNVFSKTLTISAASALETGTTWSMV